MKSAPDCVICGRFLRLSRLYSRGRLTHVVKLTSEASKDEVPRANFARGVINLASFLRLRRLEYHPRNLPTLLKRVIEANPQSVRLARR